MAASLKSGMVLQALFGYHVGVVAAGLLLHPYKTVQEVVRKGIPGSAILLPFFCWLIGFLILRTIEHFLFTLIPFLGFWWFLFVWGTSFLFFWQVLLLYLNWRFSRWIS
jgi:hypothetical protein